MRFSFVDFYRRCNFLSIVIMLTVVVIVYILMFEKEVEGDYDNKHIRNEMPEYFIPRFLRLPPRKIVDFELDLDSYLHKVDKRFLSFSIDTSQIYKGLRNPSLRDKKLVGTVKHLSGGYLRVGGTAADLLMFSPAFSAWPDRNLPTDGGSCSFDYKNCNKPHKFKRFSMSALDWNEINTFAKTTGLKLLFDLNVLIRDENNNWNSSNAELLLDFAFAYRYEIDWQLGNEPNSFKHEFDIEIEPEILAEDFDSLKKLLNVYSLYNSSLVVGPDVTNPRDLTSTPDKYLQDFLKSNPNLDAVSWHHYNTGPDASLEDFLNVATYDNFIHSYKKIQEAIDNSKVGPKPVWLTETGTSYGGGSKNLSDKFVASLLWTDKLGSGAKAGISVIVRQSLYRGAYGLLDPTTRSPNSDYWVSILFKYLVKETVLNLTATSTNYDGTLRVYAHCSAYDKVVIFGVNIANISQGINIPLNSTGHLYSLYSLDLQSSSVMLNGIELSLDSEEELPVFMSVKVNMCKTVSIPAYSIFFVVVDIIHPACIS